MRAVQCVADLHVYRSQVVAKTSLKLAIEHVHFYCFSKEDPAWFNHFLFSEIMYYVLCLTVCFVKLTMVLR